MSTVQYDAPDALIRSLADHLGKVMPSVKSVIYDFPEANEQLVYPGISVYCVKPVFTPIAPYLKSKKAAYQQNEQWFVPVQQVYGKWDLDITVDIWAKYRAQRDQLLAEITKAFSPSFEDDSIRLTLTQYFDEPVIYSFAGVQGRNTSEEQSQRGEWRLMCSVLTNCSAIREHLAPVMNVIENNLEVLDESEAAGADDPNGYQGIV